MGRFLQIDPLSAELESRSYGGGVLKIESPRLAANEAGATHSNTVHVVFLSDPLLAEPMAAAFFNSASLLPPRPEEMNAYAYVSNNPINYTDVLGLWIRNNSDKIIWVKPEHARPIKVPPRYFLDIDIDGVKPPAWGGDWYKVYGDDNITTNIEIDEDGRPHKVSGQGRHKKEVYDECTPETDRQPGRKFEPGFSNRNTNWKTQ